MLACSSGVGETVFEPRCTCPLSRAPSTAEVIGLIERAPPVSRRLLMLRRSLDAAPVPELRAEGNEGRPELRSGVRPRLTHGNVRPTYAEATLVASGPDQSDEPRPEAERE
jgi:hypothetical protein